MKPRGICLSTVSGPESSGPILAQNRLVRISHKRCPGTGRNSAHGFTHLLKLRIPREPQSLMRKSYISHQYPPTLFLVWDPRNFPPMGSGNGTVQIEQLSNAWFIGNHKEEIAQFSLSDP